MVSSNNFTIVNFFPTCHATKLSFYLHSDGIDHMIVFVNERNQTLLVPTSMYGRYFFKLPTLANSESGYIQYQIRVTERHSLPTEKLPCHEEDSKGDYSLLNCIEEYFEGNRSCSLPWRARPGGADKVCEAKEDLWAYKMYYSFLLQASEQAIYEATGCYHTCMYMVRLLQFALNILIGQKPNHVKVF